MAVAMGIGMTAGDAAWVSTGIAGSADTGFTGTGIAAKAAAKASTAAEERTKGVAKDGMGRLPKSASGMKHREPAGCSKAGVQKPLLPPKEAAKVAASFLKLHLFQVSPFDKGRLSLDGESGGLGDTA